MDILEMFLITGAFVSLMLGLGSFLSYLIKDGPIEMVKSIIEEFKDDMGNTLLVIFVITYLMVISIVYLI